MDAISSASGTGGTSTTSNANSALGDNYELFLTLLTTQLRNQDPLDPADPSEFTNQLVQYSSVEQAILTNQNLEDLIAKVSADEAYNLVGYIGSEVTAAGNETQLTNGSAVWEYNVPADATDAKIEIYNSAGALVYSEEQDLTKGSQTYTWDGKTTGGTDAPAGTYSIKFTATDANDNALAVTTEVKGIVDGVDLSGSTPYLLVGDSRIPASAVTKVETPASV